MKRVTKLSLVISNSRKSIKIDVHSCAKIKRRIDGELQLGEGGVGLDIVRVQ